MSERDFPIPLDTPLEVVKLLAQITGLSASNGVQKITVGGGDVEVDFDVLKQGVRVITCTAGTVLFVDYGTDATNIAIPLETRLIPATGITKMVDSGSDGVNVTFYG